MRVPCHPLGSRSQQRLPNRRVAAHRDHGERLWRLLAGLRDRRVQRQLDGRADIRGGDLRSTSSLARPGDA